MRSFAVFAVALLVTTNVFAADVPETVMVTYQIKPHQEDLLKQVLQKHWQTALQLKLVHAEPHIVVQGGDQDNAYIVEIFTWRDFNVPDNAPKEITELWQQMHQLTEARNGKPSVDFATVDLVSQQ